MSLILTTKKENQSLFLKDFFLNFLFSIWFASLQKKRRRNLHASGRRLPGFNVPWARKELRAVDRSGWVSPSFLLSEAQGPVPGRKAL